MGWRHDRELEKARKQKIDDNPPKCEGCGKVIPAPRRYARQVKYHSDQCRERYARARQDEKRRLAQVQAEAAELDEVLYEDDQIRRGKVYNNIMLVLEDHEVDKWVDREISDAAVAKKVGASAQAVGYARRAAVNDRLQRAAAEHFEVSDHHKELLGPSDDEMRALLDEDPVAFEAKLKDLARAFVRWRDEFFQISSHERYITKLFHMAWIIAVLRTIYLGGRLLILSPPRHGKTDLLIHFCVWLICRNPNIRILWVGPNKDIGEIALGHVKDILDEHAELKAAYLADGEAWAPGNRDPGRVWKQDRFKVANRTVQLKQPTMWATGVSGKILSMDADFIIVDDPADPDDSQTPGGRDGILKWFRMKLLTRKMRRTGLAMISSRVHIEDLYSNYIDSEKWTVLVDKAHNEMICGLDLFDEHDSEECVLFPEMNPLEHLRDQFDDVGSALFDMMFQNMPRPDGTLIFDPDRIKDYCYDYSRNIGTAELPHAVRLIAGLDPAARNIQAAFCWGIDVENDTDYMIDLDTQLAGGVAGALHIMREWHTLYDLRTWVVEDNSYQAVFFDDPRVKALAAELGLTIIPTTTGMNKHDPFFGVSGMAPRFHEGKVNLPMATREAQRKVDAYVRQLISFTGETGQKKKEKSDIRMAAWFPHADVIRKWREAARPRKVNVTDNRSYVGYGPGNVTETPWENTRYPM